MQVTYVSYRKKFTCIRYMALQVNITNIKCMLLGLLAFSFFQKMKDFVYYLLGRLNIKKCSMFYLLCIKLYFLLVILCKMQCKTCKIL